MELSTVFRPMTNMKKFLFLLFSLSLFGQQTTPNLGLQLPPHGAPNWDIAMNSNLSTLDSVIGILQTPFLGVWNSHVIYVKGQQVTFSGSLYGSLVNNNLNHSPNVSPAQWTLILSPGGGGGTPGGSSTNIQFNNSGAFGGIPNYIWNSGSNQIQSIGVDTNFSIFLQDNGTPASDCTLGKGQIFCENFTGNQAGLFSAVTNTGGQQALGEEIDVSSSTSSAVPSVIGMQINASVTTGGSSAFDAGININASGAHATQNFGINVQNGFGAATSIGAAFHSEKQSSPSNTAYSFAADEEPSVFPSLMTGVRSVTTSTNQSVSDFFIPCDATSGSVTITLKASPPNYANNPTSTAQAGLILAFKKKDSSSNTCVISGNGNNIDGNSTFTLSNQNQSVILQWDSSSQWLVIGQSLPNTPQVICSNVSPVTVNSSTTSDQNLMSCTISAGLLNSSGKMLDIWAGFVYSTPVASVATINLKAKLCTVSGCGSGTVINLASITSSANAGNVTNNSINLHLKSTTQTTGASAAFESHGNMVIDLGASPGLADSTFSDSNSSTVGTINATGTLFLQFTGAFNAASSSNSITQRQSREMTEN